MPDELGTGVKLPHNDHYQVRIAAMRFVERYGKKDAKHYEADLVGAWKRWRGDDLQDGEMIVWCDWVLTLMFWSETEIHIHAQQAEAVFRPGPRHKLSARYARNFERTGEPAGPAIDAGTLLTGGSPPDRKAG